ncbi:hypothetical protein B0H13DRAFT_1591659, partial [Mycena leptocephala]
LSAGQVAWRILGSHVAKKFPAISALPIHSRTSNRQYSWKNGLLPTLSQLERDFLRPLGSFPVGPSELPRPFSDVIYTEYYSLFCLTKYDEANNAMSHYFLEQPNMIGAPRMHVVLRNKAHTHLSRMQSVRRKSHDHLSEKTFLNYKILSWSYQLRVG